MVKDAGVPQIINVYCRDNRGPKGIISRELVKETLHEDTNEYKKLANISLDRGSGVFSYDNLEADPNVDALSCCQDAQELFALYQTCASRRQIDTLLQNYLDTYESTHDYDEYHYDLDEIEHDPMCCCPSSAHGMRGNGR